MVVYKLSNQVIQIQPPVYENMVPANKSTNIPISTSSLSLTIRDPNGDDFNYTIQTRPNVGSVSVHGTHNGTKQCTISGLKYATTYRWYVNATDGTNWKRRWYTFTTAPAPSNSLFSFSGITPGNGSRNIPISTSTLTVTIQNSKGHPFNYYIKTSPTIGSTLGGNKYNGSKTCTISNLAYSTTYYWYVSCKDVTTGQWTNQSFWFTTESNNPAMETPHLVVEAHLHLKTKYLPSKILHQILQLLLQVQHIFKQALITILQVLRLTLIMILSDCDLIGETEPIVIGLA